MPRHLRPAAVACAAACACASLAGPADAPAVDGPAHAAAATTLTLSAPSSGALRFSRTRLSASAGRVVLRLRNPSGVSHAIAVGSKSGSIVSGGRVSRVSLTVRSGRKYTYYCPVDSHRARGMRGTLTIR
jgi:uncharacterized cupredoxin-like copper-binding protein